MNLRSAARGAAAVGTTLVLASVGTLGAAAASTHGTATKTTTLTIHGPATVTAAGHYRATVTGKLRAGNTALAGQTVSLQDRAGKGKPWTASGRTAVTNTSGRVSFTFTQAAAREQYRLAYAGSAVYRASHSGAITITRTKH